jgi:hypothetical protein
VEKEAKNGTINSRRYRNISSIMTIGKVIEQIKEWNQKI